MANEKRIEIHYCTGCRWLLRAAWMAQEILSTFEHELDEVALVPSAEGGTYRIRLGEHLIFDRGEQGGGFPEVKAIKQASVMLDEHYRCPAEIIEFSNKYVYDGELKIMQWSLPEHDSSVVVNYSEQGIEESNKPTSGKFKGIENLIPLADHASGRLAWEDGRAVQKLIIPGCGRRG